MALNETIEPRKEKNKSAKGCLIIIVLTILIAVVVNIIDSNKKKAEEEKRAEQVRIEKEEEAKKVDLLQKQEQTLLQQINSEKQPDTKELLNSFTQQYTFQLARYKALRNWENTDRDKRDELYTETSIHTANYFNSIGNTIKNWSGKFHYNGSMITVTSSFNGFVTSYEFGDQLSERIKLQLRNIHNDYEVIFSGYVSPDMEKGIKEYSLTKKGSMRAPEFYCNFTDIKKNDHVDLVIQTISKIIKH
jgi:hypothetical protein